MNRNEPRVAANLVLGVGGMTTLNGSSSGLSTPADRVRFHELRKEFGVILIGGNTARHEPYAKTPLPLIVLTRKTLSGAASLNPAALSWTMPLESAIHQASERYGDILMEAGPALLREAITSRLLTDLYLTLSPVIGGENPISIEELLGSSEEISRQEVDGTLFLHYRLAPN
jgi:riboflavin biosynthesis pyrimidine reductase